LIDSPNMSWACAFCFSALSSRDAAPSTGVVRFGLRVHGCVSADTPASQTLIVLSLEPDTMVAPSGEKATEVTVLLCALCFSALSSREAVASMGTLSFGMSEEYGRLRYLHPRL
jgi:hypothetical protein